MVPRHANISRRAALLGSLAAIAAAPPPAIPVDTSGGRCCVAVDLDGKQAQFIIDTGAQTSVLSHQAALRLGLRQDGWVATTLRGAGGKLERYANIDIAHARLGAVPLFQRRPAEGLSLPVTTAPIGADGLLGGDILRHYTIDLNVRAGQLMLGAPYSVPPSTPTVKLQLLRMSLLLAPVLLNGHALLALIDTGASTSLINARGLHRLGVAGRNMARDPAVPMQALGGESQVRVHRFNDLRIGALAFAAPVLLEADVPEPAYDLVLGIDILGRQNIFLSYPALTLALGPAAL